MAVSFFSERSIPLPMTTLRSAPTPPVRPTPAAPPGELSASSVPGGRPTSSLLRSEAERALTAEIDQRFDLRATYVLGLPGVLSELEDHIERRLQARLGEVERRELEAFRDRVISSRAECVEIEAGYRAGHLTALESVELHRAIGGVVWGGCNRSSDYVASRAKVERWAEELCRLPSTELAQWSGVPVAVAERCRARVGVIALELAPLVDRLVRGNLALVGAVLREYRVRGDLYDELTSAGQLALVRCVRDYDPGYGARFSSYAFPSIQHAVREELYRIWRGGGPRYQPGEGTRVRCVSLETARHRGDEESSTLGESLVNTTSPDPAVEVTRADDNRVSREIIGRGLADLPSDEQLVLRRLFGLDDGRCATIAEVAAELRVSAENVRQSRARAERRLRSFLIERSHGTLSELGYDEGIAGAATPVWASARG